MAPAATQDDAIHSLLTQGGLQEVCDIPHTWHSTTTWSSLDYITISTNTPLTTHSPYWDTTPWKAHLSGHALLGVTITSFGKVHNSRRRTPFPRFRKDNEKEYAERVASLLDNFPPSPISFTKACIAIHLASSPRYTKQSVPATHSLHKTYQLLVAHLHQWEKHSHQPINPHPLIASEPLWDRVLLVQRIASLKDTINNKARKRATLRCALFRKRPPSGPTGY
jgi:hypothetical protein